MNNTIGLSNDKVVIINEPGTPVWLERCHQRFHKKPSNQQRRGTKVMFKKIKPWFTKPITHHKLSAVYVALYITVLPMVARADVVDVLQNVFSYLTGGVGKAVAALAIVAVGFGCFAMGKIPKGYVIAVVLGVGIIFGAKALLSMLGTS